MGLGFKIIRLGGISTATAWNGSRLKALGFRPQGLQKGGAEIKLRFLLHAKGSMIRGFRT